MKLLIMCCVSILSVFFQQSNSIYSISCTKSDGATLPLRHYKGKKTLFVVLPLAGDTAFYNGLALFQQKYHDSVNIVGIPTAENGFDTEKLKAVSAGIVQPNMVVLGVTITTPGAETPSPLMEWLTKKEKNDHYQINNVTGGLKFFIDEHGTLYAVMGPRVSFTATVMDKIVQRPRPVIKTTTPAH